MSSNGLILPPVSVSEIRGSNAADKLKGSVQQGNAKIEKSAKEFEAVLLSHWLDQAQQSFATVPGSNPDEDDDPGRDQYHSLAMQAVGAALSGGRGGLGIARMVARHLETSAISKETKQLSVADPQTVPEGKK